ncbi:MAG: hypothetical protein GF355_07170 [Candidatus Eisenbacteria bacterium]|nr:hypothetical protein [Candidatus Eisenbacteria bacterium]
MRQRILLSRSGLLATGCALLAAGAWLLWPASHAPQAGPADQEIVMAYGPGGVLTRDGGLWQYRPENREWVSIDQSFREQGLESHVLPLPVPAEQIREMASFGFLVTKSGACWLFDVESDEWIDIGTPSDR